MTILKEVVVTTGSYTDKSGATKKRYARIGHLHEGQHGQYLTLDPMVNLAAIPRKDGDDRVYANLYDPKPKQGAQAAADTNEDAPF